MNADSERLTTCSSQRGAIKQNAIECQGKVLGWTQKKGTVDVCVVTLVEDLDVNGELLALARDADGATHLEALLVAIIEVGMKRGGASVELIQLLVHQSTKKGHDHPCPRLSSCVGLVCEWGSRPIQSVRQLNVCMYTYMCVCVRGCVCVCRCIVPWNLL